MSREYQLFYDPGSKGFSQTTNYLDEKLAPHEPILGYKDLGFYLSRPFHSLYDWGSNAREINISRIDSLTQNRIVQYLAYNSRDLYSDQIFQSYLSKKFIPKKVFEDYHIWKYIE